MRNAKEKTVLLLSVNPSPVLKLMLPALGYRRVIEAETAPEAVALMRAEPVHLVFAPWEFPGLSGTALMKALRYPGRNREVPVVLLDDGLAPASVVAAVKAGIAGKVSLPGNMVEVRQVLREMERGGLGHSEAENGTLTTGNTPENTTVTGSKKQGDHGEA